MPTNDIQRLSHRPTLKGVGHGTDVRLVGQRKWDGMGQRDGGGEGRSQRASRTYAPPGRLVVLTRNNFSKAPMTKHRGGDFGNVRPIDPVSRLQP